MTRPIPDQAEVALEYPDKLYIGTFAHASRFEAHLDVAGLALTLEKPGDEATRKSVHLHLNYELLAEILHDIAANAAKLPAGAEPHRASLAKAATALAKSLGKA